MSPSFFPAAALFLLFFAYFGLPLQEQTSDSTKSKPVQHILSEKELKHQLFEFRKRIESCEQLEFTKIGESGDVALRFRGERLRFELEEIASCIDAEKIIRFSHIPDGFHKPFAIPAWSVRVLVDSTSQDKDKEKQVDSSIRSVLLEDKNLTVFFADGTTAICKVDRDIPFGKDNKLWSLFGKLLLLTVR